MLMIILRSGRKKMIRFCRVSVCCTSRYRLKRKTMQVVVAPFLVLRRLQIGNFVVFFFFVYSFSRR